MQSFERFTWARLPGSTTEPSSSQSCSCKRRVIPAAGCVVWSSGPHEEIPSFRLPSDNWTCRYSCSHVLSGNSSMLRRHGDVKADMRFIYLLDRRRMNRCRGAMKMMIVRGEPINRNHRMQRPKSSTDYPPSKTGINRRVDVVAGSRRHP